MNYNWGRSVTRKYTIGRVGVTGKDYNFAAAADHVQQNLDMGAIVPAKCKVTDIQVVCTVAVVGVTDFTVVVGNASAGAQFIVALSCNALNEVVGIINPDLPQAVVVNWAAATNIWIGADPTDNTWNLMTAGEWAVYVTLRDYSSL
jgi:hypothetical protein